MQALKIAFVGGGNMGRALIGGIVGAPGGMAATITVADPDPAVARLLAGQRSVRCVADSGAAVEGADVVVLAVKPQILAQVARAVGAQLAARRPLVISIAAGIDTRALGAWLGQATPIVRAMPNTPALIGRGATALYATPAVDAGGRAIAERIMGAVGATDWVVDEAQIDVVTALSGSGPAYVFFLLECLERAAVAEGLPAATARRLAVETMAGAAELVRQSGSDPQDLRAQVTSKGGTTERALEVLEEGGFDTLIARAIAAATGRARELAREFGR